jgi:hypothetical protein
VARTRLIAARWPATASFLTSGKRALGAAGALSTNEA